MLGKEEITSLIHIQYNTSGRYFPSSSLQQILDQPDQAAVFQLICVPMMKTICSSLYISITS
jgi:hypothetical protein